MNGADRESLKDLEVRGGINMDELEFMWRSMQLENAYKQMDQPSQYEQTDGNVQDLRIVPVDEGRFYPDNVIEVF
jgi:hypothetical protein